MKVVILGATGAVGRQMLECLEERNIKCELKLLASARSVGRSFKFFDEEIKIEEAKPEAFEGADYVLGAVSNELAKKFAPAIVKAGAIFIDNSSAFRLDNDVPLVIPEINKEDIKLNKGIIANPNCSTIITLMAIYGINKVSKIEKIIASTYQAVSGAGIEGMSELQSEIRQINEGQRVEPKVFSHQIAYNCIPAIGSVGDNGYFTEEMKMQNEGRKILHLPSLKVTCTCVRVPVIRSHSISVSLETEKKLTVEQVKAAIKESKGVELVDNPGENKYPMPLNTSDQDLVQVGRIREDLVFDKGIALWCCGDQIRKGAASNAVQIMECCIDQ